MSECHICGREIAYASSSAAPLIPCECAQHIAAMTGECYDRKVAKQLVEGASQRLEILTRERDEARRAVSIEAERASRDFSDACTISYAQGMHSRDDEHRAIIAECAALIAERDQLKARAEKAEGDARLASWTPVAQTPFINGLFLVYTYSGWIGSGKFDLGIWWLFDDQMDEWYASVPGTYSAVTHWMRLPDPPKPYEEKQP